MLNRNARGWIILQSYQTWNKLKWFQKYLRLCKRWRTLRNNFKQIDARLHFLFSSMLLAIISLVCNTLGLEKKANFNLPETISWEGNNFKIHNFQCRWQLWGDSGYQGYLMVQWPRRMEASCNLQVFVWDWCRIFPIRRANMCHEIRELDLWWLPGRSSCQIFINIIFLSSP